VGWSQVVGLLATAGSMFLVILAQSAATSRAYAVRYRERFVEDDDLLGLAGANLAAGLSSTFVVNGSPTKTEMADEAHSRTQVAQLTTAVVVAIVLLFLTKPLQYLPNAVLAAVVFVIGVKLVDVAHMREIWRLRKDEFWVAVTTAVVVVCIGVEQGIVLAVILSLVLHLRRHYAPHDAVVGWDADGRIALQPPVPGTVSEEGLVIYRFGVGLFYANAQRLSNEALALVDVPTPPRWFVLEADAIDDVDYTGGQTLAELADSLSKRGITFGVSGASSQLRRQLDAFGVSAQIGGEHYFDDVDAARDAFRRSIAGR
jgi:MFS superfamily sulfate permease-like transporter